MVPAVEVLSCLRRCQRELPADPVVAKRNGSGDHGEPDQECGEASESSWHDFAPLREPRAHPFVPRITGWRVDKQADHNEWKKEQKVLSCQAGETEDEPGCKAEPGRTIGAE